MLGQGTWFWWPSHVGGPWEPSRPCSAPGQSLPSLGEGFPCLPQRGFSHRPRLERAGARTEGIPALPASRRAGTGGTEPGWQLRALLGPARGEKTPPEQDTPTAVSGTPKAIAGTQPGAGISQAFASPPPQIAQRLAQSSEGLGASWHSPRQLHPTLLGLSILCLQAFQQEEGLQGSRDVYPRALDGARREGR